jgi:hypothetical protein
MGNEAAETAAIPAGASESTDAHRSLVIGTLISRGLVIGHSGPLDCRAPAE